MKDIDVFEYHEAFAVSIDKYLYYNHGRACHGIFYAPGLKGPPGASSNLIVRLSVRPSVCPSVIPSRLHEKCNN